MCILLLEDDLVISDILSEALNDAGWPVHVATRLDVARAYLDDGDVRVMIVDEFLGVQADSYGFGYLAWAGWPALSIIYLTVGVAIHPGHRLRPREWAVSKPFRLAAMVQTVRVALAA